MNHLKNERIAIIGLGYVGLPVALAAGKHFNLVTGFDIDARKVAKLRKGEDDTHEHNAEALTQSRVQFTHDPQSLTQSNFFIVAVPTPVDQNNRPDLQALRSASEVVGRALKVGDIVVYESTVYPGVTEEICGPILERISGLKAGSDFGLGYSPERINPGDKVHGFEQIIKVVSGDTPETLARVAAVYRQMVTAGIFCAASIKVAEAAKVIENTQRDLNIALMNELSIIFDKMGIHTQEVLEAAATKWNFLRFTPGLVGGHCIGVDPYYLTTKAEELGYQPQVILAGRRINNGMGAHIAQKTVKLLSHCDHPIKGSRVALLGVTFKENVSDIRNSRVPDIANELAQFGVKVLIHDPLAHPQEAKHEYGITLCSEQELQGLDGVILAVPHRAYDCEFVKRVVQKMAPGGVFIDVKSAIKRSQLPSTLTYWSL